jgi:hypothetical protein
VSGPGVAALDEEVNTEMLYTPDLLVVSFSGLVVYFDTELVVALYEMEASVDI